jgi:5'-nucleotidase
MTRILVTNDDGISSTGLHVLARTMRAHGEVVVVAPEVEHSGAGAGVGPLHLINPQAHTTTIEGIDEAWSVNGSPALCTMFARFGVFGPISRRVRDQSGGQRRSRRLPLGYGRRRADGAQRERQRGRGQSGCRRLRRRRAGVGRHDPRPAVADRRRRLVASPPTEPVVVNVNVPNLPLEEIKGWRHATVAATPPRALTSARLEPISGKEGCYSIKMEYGDPIIAPSETDSGAIERDEVAVTYLSRLHSEACDDLGALDEALYRLLPAAERAEQEV